MSDASSFGKLVPGFDFLQNLVKNAGSALPGIGQWVAPTLDPAELEKRISELRTVQYWLEQNVRMLAATIQALEVQRMTLSTLKSMNVQMGDLTESLRIKPASERADTDAVGRAPAPASAPAKKAATAKAAAPAVDPMQWWGALTNQFAELATNAMKDSAADAAKSLAGGMMKQSIAAAGETMRQVAGAPGRAVAGAAKSLASPSTADRSKTSAPARKKKKTPSRPRATPEAT